LASPATPLDFAAGASPAGPWAPLAALANAALSSPALTDAPQSAAVPANGGGSLPPAPEPASSGGSAGGTGSGVGFSLLLALLFSIAAFGLQYYSRLRLPPAQWRRLAFVAVIERPG